MALCYLNVPYTVQDVNFDAGEHFSEEFLKVWSKDAEYDY